MLCLPFSVTWRLSKKESEMFETTITLGNNKMRMSKSVQKARQMKKYVNKVNIDPYQRPESFHWHWHMLHYQTMQGHPVLHPSFLFQRYWRNKDRTDPPHNSASSEIPNIRPQINGSTSYKSKFAIHRTCITLICLLIFFW